MPAPKRPHSRPHPHPHPRPSPNRGPAKGGKPKGPHDRPARPAPAEGPRERYLARGLRIMHEDDDVLVLDKPAGMLTATPAGEDHESVFGLVKQHVKNERAKRGTRAWIIHRLDREASGLLVFAKSERAYEMLKAELQARRTHRIYTAVVEGTFAPAEQSGTIQSFLYEDLRGTMHPADSPREVPKHLRRGESEDEMNAARPAVTHYKVLSQARDKALVSVKLETGRKHQIRAHMAQVGHPIAGDRRYDHRADPRLRLCLHATELGFTHPATGQFVTFDSPVPPLFRKIAGLSRDDLTPPPPTPTPTPGPAHPVAATPAARPGGKQGTLESSWNHVAGWYDDLLEDRVSDHHEQVILPGAQRLLGLKPGERVLDVACGQGILCRRLAATGAEVVGVDAAPRLVERAAQLGPGTYLTGDARDLKALGLTAFDAVSCVMAIMNIEPISSVFAGVASLLRPGGRFVLILLHPAFRAPGQTFWGWEEGEKDKKPRQYRRVDGYLSTAAREIVMNPGAVSSGKEKVTTMTYHRPIQAYINALAAAGLATNAMEEWPSVRTSQPGPRAAEENRARREIPMFLALRAVKA